MAAVGWSSAADVALGDGSLVLSDCPLLRRGGPGWAQPVKVEGMGTGL